MGGRPMRMRDAFDAPFLWLVCFIYFTQGFRSFVWTAVSYQLKDVLKLSPSVSQFLTSVAFFPWSIKPLYGILSDCMPIKGRKRIPYLVISTILSLFPWILLGSVPSIRSSQFYLVILLTIQNIGSAMADVVIDAMIAEAVRSERAAFAGDLQTLSWSAMAFGGIFGSLLGGHSLSNIEINTVFLLFSILPSIQLVSCIFADEVPLRGKILAAESDGEGQSKSVFGEPVKLMQVNHAGLQTKATAGISNGNETIMEPPRIDARKRRRSKKNGKSEQVNPGPNNKLELQRELYDGCSLSLKSAFHSLCHAFRKPTILRPMAWFFIAHITVPNLSTVMFYYQTEVLHLEASFLGATRVVGWFGLLLGSFIYNRYLKRVRLRRILMWSHIGLAGMSFLDIVTISRKNVELGISDRYMVLGGSALSDAINQFKMMPFLILSGQLCPPGIEGTLFALFMSINNLGSTVGSFLGTALASLLNISSNSFDNLLLGVSVQLISTFIPLCFLFLIPREATGISS